MQERPQPGDYNPYYETYIQKVPQGDLPTLLNQQHEEAVSLLRALPAKQWAYRYAPGKWSVKQVVGHIADTERIMAYRLLCIARGETAPLPGFDQDIYVPGASFDDLTEEALLHELHVVRQSTLSLLAGLGGEAWQRKGTVSGGPMTPLALACVIFGHELHHLAVLKERYFSK